MKIILLLSLIINMIFSKSVYEFDNREPDNNTFIISNEINNNQIQLYNGPLKDDDDKKKYEEEKILLENIRNSIREYYLMLRELKSSTTYKNIDWKSYNDSILSELCIEGVIDEDLYEDVCAPYIKTYQLDILLNENDTMDIDEIIEKYNKKNKRYILSNIN